MRDVLLRVDEALSTEIRSAASTADCESVVRKLQDQLARTLPPPPAASQHDAQPTAGQLAGFLRYGYLIKETERRGWALAGLTDCETVACHMYRTALMAMVLEHDKLDTNRCVQMALVHDLAEALVGDITPDCGVGREEKHRLEAEAMQTIVATMAGSAAGEKIHGLWWEYERNETAEAHYVHQLDKLEFALQTAEYEEKHGVRLDSFLASARAQISDGTLCALFDAVVALRGGTGAGQCK